MSQAQVLTSPSVSLFNGRPATTSLAVAEYFGKPHDKVMRDIRKLRGNCPENFTDANFGGSEYQDSTGRTLPMFIIYFDGFILLVMGYTGKKALQMKLAYIAAFNAMKEKLDKLAKEERAALSGNVKQIPDGLSTAASRAPLRSLVHAWAQISGVSHTALWPQVKAYFQLTRIDDLPESWIPDALAFVQEKIDQCGKGLPQPAAAPALPPAKQERLPLYRDGSFYPPHKNRRHVAGPREKALMDFWTREYGQRVAELERQFNALADDLTAARGDLFCHAVSELGRSADTMFSIEAITEGLFAPLDCARDNFREALRLTRLHLRMAANVAVALNR